MPADASRQTVNEARIKASFEAGAAAWEEYANTPLGRMRQDLILHHLLEHPLLAEPCNVLDAGAGTGGYALALARSGHRVVVVDYCGEMLRLARKHFASAGDVVLARAEFLCAPVDSLAQQLSNRRFGLLMIHTLLEYLPDPEAALGQLLALTAPGALVSIVIVNEHSNVWRLGAIQRDPDRALAALSGSLPATGLFSTGRRLLDLERVQRMLDRAGFEITARYGIRIFADGYTADDLSQPATYQALMALEAAAGKRDPYRQLGRYHHLLGVRSRY